MNNLNKIVLTGNLIKDAEYKVLANDKAVLSFCVANNLFNKTSFFECNVWDKHATAIKDFMKKGTGVAVEGRITQDTWEKDGQKRSKMVVNVSNLQMFGKSNKVAAETGPKNSEIPF